MNERWSDRYEPVIGLEVHVQLSTKSKIFCGCSTDFGRVPNSQVCPVCLGHPGVLPVLNRDAVTAAIRFGTAVGAQLDRRSRFARKNYFYPDLPKGYQITQYEEPILRGGAVPVRGPGGVVRVPLHRAHLEEDAGKSVHTAEGGGRGTWIDLNRAGVPLLEVVTEPALASPEEAHRFLVRMRQLIRYLGIGDGNMEEGSLRCDANISVRPKGGSELFAKTEIKNLNSFRHVELALNWEFARQAAAMSGGARVPQETRLWNEATGRTRVMRTKEEAEDYRYFPEPDLDPILIDEAWISTCAGAMPDPPWEREDRLIGEWGLREDDAVILAGDPELADYFQTAAEESGNPRATAGWVINEVLRLLKEGAQRPRDLRVTPRNLGRLVVMLDEGAVSGKIAKRVFATMAKAGGEPADIVRAAGLDPIRDGDALAKLARELVAEHPEAAAEYRGGKSSTVQFFIGLMMRSTGGRADPAAARAALEAALGGAPEEGKS